MATSDEVLITALSNNGLNISGQILTLSFFAAIFVIIYVMLGEKVHKQGVKILIAATPFFVADLLLDYGEYTFDLPLVGLVKTTIFVNTLNIIDYIAYFRVFDSAKDIILSYDSSGYQLGAVTTGIIFVYNYVDTLFQIALLSMGAYSIITWYENTVNKKIQNYKKVLLSLFIGMAPSTYMMLSFSNPIEEYAEMTGYAQDVSYFLNYGNSGDVLYVALLGLFAFALLFMIMLVIVHTTFAIIINTSLKSGLTDMSNNYPLYAFAITLVYTLVYIVHPEYTWHKIFIYLLAYYLFKKFYDGVVSEAKGKNSIRSNQNAIAKLVAGEMRQNNSNTMQYNAYHKKYDDSKWSVIVPFLIGIALLAYGLYKLFYA